MNEDGGCSKWPPARPQGTRPPRRTVVYVEGFERLRTQMEDFFSNLDDGGMVSLPILIKLLELGQAGEVRHTIEKDFSNQMV